MKTHHFGGIYKEKQGMFMGYVSFREGNVPWQLWPLYVCRTSSVPLLLSQKKIVSLETMDRLATWHAHWIQGGSSLPTSNTLPKTDTAPLRIGHPKRQRSYSNHPSLGMITIPLKQCGFVLVFQSRCLVFSHQLTF